VQAGTGRGAPKWLDMGRRVVSAVVALAVGLAVAAGAGAADITQEKQQVDTKLQQLKGQIAEIRRKEEGLRAEIVQVNGVITQLQGKVGTVSSQLDQLRHDLSLRRQRVATLRGLFRLETKRLGALRVEYRGAMRQLERRLVDLYQQADPTAIDVALSAASIQDFLDNYEYVQKIGAQDRRIVTEVATARSDMTRARARTRRVAAGVAAEARVIAARAAQVSVVRNELVAEQGRLTSARDGKRQSLDSLTVQERQEAEEMDALAAASARLADQIRAAQEAARRAAEQRGQQQSAGPVGQLAWPAQGAVTSPFGQRWGRMHTGIDIGAPEGAPIVAAAAGTVLVAGWVEGYGNTVVIDHGGGIATLYGHQSSIAVAVGQPVTRGQVVGAVGNTGHSTGPHLHFEVRVNGSPVDPLGYL
jgi:murein DD-endopeptidase MepM/ murein hydrolase activator NlpD